MTPLTPFNWQDEPQLLEVLRGNVAPSSNTPMSAEGMGNFEQHLYEQIGNVELGYAEITANFATTSTSLTDVTGLDVDVEVGTRPVIVVFSAGYLTASDVTGAELAICDGSNNVLARIKRLFGDANEGFEVHRWARHNPGPGEQTYKIRLRVPVAGTATIGADAPPHTTYGPASIHVLEV